MIIQFDADGNIIGSEAIWAAVAQEVERWEGPGFDSSGYI